MKCFLLNTDNRLIYLHKLLKDKNCALTTFKNILCSSQNNDLIILPPNYKWVKETAEQLPNNITIVCGNTSEEILQIFKTKNIKYLNLMQDETFVLKNATLTAEGFLADLILNTPNSIFEQKILLLGGGRVAKAVGILFNKLGINFDITMRNETKLIDAQIYASNIINWKFVKTKLKNYDVVINTIPNELFVKKDLQKFKLNTTVFELASTKVFAENCFIEPNCPFAPFTQLPNGNVYVQKKLQNIKYVLSPALPGRYLPQSAGKLIYNFLKSNNLLKNF